MEKKGVIYKIENLVNGKVYIGQTAQGFKKRISQHKYELNKNTHKNAALQNAWNKYKKRNFKFSILLECCVSDMDELEIELISEYKKKKKSYNIDDGGNKNRKVSNETRNKMSKIAKVRFSDRGYKEEMKKRVKKHWVDGRYDEKVKRQKEVSRNFICIDTQEIFSSASEISEKLQVNIKCVYNACIGKQESVFSKDGKRYQIAYYEEGKTYKTKELRNGNSKKVVCLTTNQVFENIQEASEKMKTHKSNIVNACKGKLKSAGKLPDGTKLRWAYYDEHLSN